MKLLKNLYVRAGVATASGLTALQANAASQMDTAALTAFQTDITDTAAEYKTWVIGVIFALAVVGLAINMSRKATSKVGGRI